MVGTTWRPRAWRHHTALRAEARRLAQERLDDLVVREGHAALSARVDTPGSEDVVGSDGRVWQVETEVWRDVGTDLRVVVSVDDGGLMALLPPTVGTVVASDDRPSA